MRKVGQLLKGILGFLSKLLNLELSLIEANELILVIMINRLTLEQQVILVGRLEDIFALVSIKKTQAQKSWCRLKRLKLKNWVFGLNLD